MNEGQHRKMVWKFWFRMKKWLSLGKGLVRIKWLISRNKRGASAPLSYVVGGPCIEVSEDEIVALKNVTINEPFFNGHSQYPVMPGVLIMEALAQTAGAGNCLKKKQGKLAYAGMDKVV